MIKKFNLFFLTFFMIGKIKYAPGTFASIFACLLFFIFISIFNFFSLLIVITIIFLYSFIAINNSYEQFEEDDPKEIVIDEVVGQALPLLAIPIYETLYPIPLIYYFIPSLLLFRLFDIWKPYPIGYIDNNVEGSIGIMLDDIIAGFYTIIFLIIIFFFIGG